MRPLVMDAEFSFDGFFGGGGRPIVLLMQTMKNCWMEMTNRNSYSEETLTLVVPNNRDYYSVIRKVEMETNYAKRVKN